MATNNSTEADLRTMSSSTNFLNFAACFVRVTAGFATIMNICVLLLLVRLKRNFRNYNYWFQILVLSSEDLFNGISSLLLTFFDSEIFRTSAIACGFVLCAYVCSQINTLLGICCICVNRFRSILTIDKLREPTFGYQQEISVLLAVLISIVYSILPYLIFPLNRSVMPVCSTQTLLGPNVQAYKLMLAFGLLIPLAIINVLYSICLAKLRRVNAKIRPTDGQGTSNYITGVSMTEETHERTSGSKDKSRDWKTNVTQLPEHSYEHCSTSVGTDTTLNAGKNKRLAVTRARVSKKEGHSRAVKLLGIILLLTNITVIIPVSLLLRDTFAPELQSGGSAALGMMMLPLNSLVDAFVYGFFSVEIRTYIYTKLVCIGRLFYPQVNATG